MAPQKAPRQAPGKHVLSLSGECWSSRARVCPSGYQSILQRHPKIDFFIIKAV
jgi:hypothetical protein